MSPSLLPARWARPLVIGIGLLGLAAFGLGQLQKPLPEEEIEHFLCRLCDSKGLTRGDFVAAGMSSYGNWFTRSYNYHYYNPQENISIDISSYRGLNPDSNFSYMVEQVVDGREIRL